MKALANLLQKTVIVLIILCQTTIITAQMQSEFNVFVKNPVPIVNNKLGAGYTVLPYDVLELDYHAFKMQGENNDWYLKYKDMYDFRCKEPFLEGGPTYTKKDYFKQSYKFRLVDNQKVEDSIQFLLNKYHLNNVDTLKKWNLPANIWNLDMANFIERLGQQHFKFVITVFDNKKYASYIDVPEAEQMNDEMVIMRVFKYPADVDIFLFNFEKNNWEYVESVTVSGDHELELYVLQKFEPRYLENCK
ncbi:hypothetical protein [Candidatus Symbiothrix dinenymphae]|uniref:hypothetical protein n=1 Tax=Candidatus Symbiothrix dinenymphae TaxID=467085 RepID=UPI000A835608|nr:hypothetical protein [Candidatus Symbiothrix dinenymphae]